MRAWAKRWGEYLLALVCVTVIVFASVYTRQEDLQRVAVRGAAGSQDQTLGEAVPPPAWHAPIDGALRTPFQGARRDAAGFWRFSPAVQYAAAYGQPVFAMAAGRISEATADSLTLTTAEGIEIVYAQLGALRVQAGEQVDAGQRIASGGNGGTISIVARKDDVYIDPEALLK